MFLGVGASVRGWKQRPEAPFLASVPLLARALRLEHLTVLKMYCEGCECAPPCTPLTPAPGCNLAPLALLFVQLEPGTLSSRMQVANIGLEVFKLFCVR